MVWDVTNRYFQLFTVIFTFIFTVIFRYFQLFTVIHKNDFHSWLQIFSCFTPGFPLELSPELSPEFSPKIHVKFMWNPCQIYPNFMWFSSGWHMCQNSKKVTCILCEIHVVSIQYSRDFWEILFRTSCRFLMIIMCILGSIYLKTTWDYRWKESEIRMKFRWKRVRGEGR